MLKRYVVGLDLGQTQDPSALAVAEATEVVDPERPPRMRRLVAIRHLQRWPLGTGYPTIVAQVKQLLQRDLLRGSTLAVDATGVGRAVVEMFRMERLPAVLQPVVISCGQHSTATAGTITVPKKDLVGVLQALLSSRRLTVAPRLREADTLRKEFQIFSAKVTKAGNEIYEALRERDHDDLVLAVALACWVVEGRLPASVWPDQENLPIRTWRERIGDRDRNSRACEPSAQERVGLFGLRPRWYPV
jgi:hypothetical protein